MIQYPERQNLTFDNPFPIQTDSRTVRTHIHFLVTCSELAIFTNVGVQTDNIHIVNFSPA